MVKFEEGMWNGRMIGCICGTIDDVYKCLNDSYPDIVWGNDPPLRFQLREIAKEKYKVGMVRFVELADGKPVHMSINVKIVEN